MNPSYLKSDEFQAADEHFNAIIESLLSEAMSGCEHGEVENFLHREGYELLRRLLQGYLDVRSRRENKLSVVIDSEGVERTHRRSHCQRALMSEFGEVVMDRLGYSGRGLTTLYPLDRELNLPPDKYSHGLRLRAVEEAIKGSFDDSGEAIQNTTGGKVPKSQLRSLVAQASQAFMTYYEQKESEGVGEEDILVLSGDGKGIVMREEDLRPETQKAAQKQKKKPGLRLKAGEKSHRKRMAQVAASYDIQPHVRSAQDMVHLPKQTGPQETTPARPKLPRPRPRNKRVWASVEESLEEVMEPLFDEALDRDPAQTRPWVMVIDGHEDQLRTIHRLVKQKKVKLTIIMDLIHVIEYLWKAAFGFFDSHHEHDAAEQWVSDRLLALLEGNASGVAAGMRRSATRQNLSQEKRKAVDTCADYWLKYKDFLHYDRYLAKGYPIGSGVIEGACRHLINDRLAITGARWRLTSSEALLKLRSLKSSGDLNDYFKFHQAQELQRNHVSKFESVEKMVA